MNFTESFSEFSSRLGPTDLALYAGVGVVLWVLFKDQISPVQKIVLDFINKLKGVEAKTEKTINTPNGKMKVKSENLFFDLVVSWKQTRDLAEKSGCTKAVEVADQMFPYLSPMVCEDLALKREDENEE